MLVFANFFWCLVPGKLGKEKRLHGMQMEKLSCVMNIIRLSRMLMVSCQDFFECVFVKLIESRPSLSTK
jgi:hypothetical protein